VLLEAGPALLGAFFDQQVVDEVHIFVSPKILGGTQPRSAVAGIGHSSVPSMAQLQHLQVRQLDSDVLIEGRWIRQ
jgi:diaminohydroxyphosphoribosylaminopyrimidine deaminase/5-amino-6-(5-phosphoribosylamino)uracil reductase